MRSEKFHPKGEKSVPVVVDEASRLTVYGTEPVNVFQVDDDGRKVKLLCRGTDFKVKLNDVNEVLLESKGDFNSVLDGPDPLDTTPLEVPVEKPLTQTQQLKMWLQNENNLQAQARAEMTWEDFKDLGDLDDGDEFYEQFGQPTMTKYEMQAEALRQHVNPNRGMDIGEQLHERDTTKSVDSDSGAADIGGRGSADDKGEQQSKSVAKEAQGESSEGGRT